MESAKLPIHASLARTKIRRRTPRSEFVSQMSRSMLAREVIQTIDIPDRLFYPIYFDSGKGAYIYDLDGNEYIDTTLGFGANILGHSDPVISSSIKQTAMKGWHFGLHNEDQVNLAKIIKSSSAAIDKLIFCNTGTEATMLAIRAARAYKKQKLTAVFTGSYHGMHDYALVRGQYKSKGRIKKFTFGSGIPEDILSTVVVLPYLEDEALEIIKKMKDELACVVIQAVQNRNPVDKGGSFAKEVIDTCKECGIVSILDEVVTGFRVAYGGAQEIFDLSPDIAVYGKIIGGGLPIGAVGGREEIMSVFSQKLSNEDEGRIGIFSGGTFSGNPLSMSAGISVLTFIKNQGRVFYDALDTNCSRYCSEIMRYCYDAGYPVKVKNFSSLFTFEFHDECEDSSQGSEAQRQFFLHALDLGLVLPGVRLSFLSSAHSEKVVEKMIEITKESLERLRKDRII